MTIETFSIEIEAKTSSLESELNRVAQITERNADRMKSSFMTVSHHVDGLRGAFASLSTVITTTLVSSEMLKAAQEAEQASNRMSATLRATGFAAGLAKSDLDGLADSMAKSTQFDDESIRNAESAFLKFGNIQDGVFQRGIKLSADLASFLGTDIVDAAHTVGKALSSSEGMGALERQIGKFTAAQKAQIESFDAANDSIAAQSLKLDILQSKIGGTAEMMNSGLSKATSDISKAWDEMLEAMGRTPVFKGIVETEFSGLSQFLQDLTEQLNGTSDVYRNTMGLMLKDFGLHMPGIYGAAIAASGALVSTKPESAYSQSDSGYIKGGALDPEILAANASKSRRQNVIDQSYEAWLKDWNAELAKEKTNQERLAKSAQDFTDSIQKQANTLGLTRAQTILYEASLKNLSPEQLKVVVASAQQIDKFQQNEKAAKALEKATEEMAKAQAEFIKFLDEEALRQHIEQLNELEGASRAVADATQEIKDRYYKLWFDSLDPAEQLNLQVNELKMKLDELGIDDADIFERLKKGLEDTSEASREAKRMAHDLGMSFTSAFEDAAINGKKLKDVLASLAQDVERMFIRKTLTEPLMNSLSNVFSGMDIGSIFSGGGGSGTSFSGGISLAGFREAGGPVSAGNTYMVGEKGPELFTPSVSGAVLPNGAYGSAPTVVIYQTNHIDSRTDSATIVSLMRQTKQETEASIMSSLQRGGAFAKAIGRA